MSSASHRARMSAPRDDEAVAVAAEDEGGVLHLRADDSGASLVAARGYDYIALSINARGSARVRRLYSDDIRRLIAWLESKAESHAHAAVDQGERADVEAITGCDVCRYRVEGRVMTGVVTWCSRLNHFVADGIPSFRPLNCPLTHGQQHAPQTETAPVASNGKAATE